MNTLTTQLAQPQGLALFDTTIGACGIAWGANGIVGAQLPEASEAATWARLQRRFPGFAESVAPPEVRQVIEGLVALLRGEPSALDGVRLDMTGVPEFHRRVYELALAIRPGTTLTYGEVARQLGDASLARAVGQALGRNPFAPLVPCHRVLAAGGKAGGFSATGGLAMKLRLLTIEAAPLGTQSNGSPGLFDKPVA